MQPRRLASRHGLIHSNTTAFELGSTRTTIPREAIRALMERLGSSWFAEDDGWYATVHWVGERFPIPGVDQATLFLRPWRDPRPGERLPGEPYE